MTDLTVRQITDAAGGDWVLEAYREGQSWDEFVVAVIRLLAGRNGLCTVCGARLEQQRDSITRTVRRRNRIFLW